MGRISGVDMDCVEPSEDKVFAKQIEEWGTTLEPYKIYARRSSIFQAVN